MSLGTDDICGVEFGIMSDDHIKSLNNNVISVPDTGNNSDIINSIASGILGSIHERITCPTCHFTKEKCTGHSGFISLGTPICSSLFIENIVKYLNIICFECGGIIITVKENMGFAKISSAVTARKNKSTLTCENIVDYVNGEPVICGALHPHVYENRKDARSILVQEFHSIDPVNKTKKKEKMQILLPYEVYRVLSRITPETLKKLGITNPELAPVNMVNSLFYVPPNSVRPNALSTNLSKVPKNDFNVQLNAILKESNKLGDSSLQLEEKKNINVIKEIQKSDFNIKRSTNTSQEKQLNSYLTVLGGKTGYIRGALLGGRVTGVSRHFITGNPDARLDEVYIPQSIAMKNMVPVTVTASNIEELSRFVANAGDEYPRCRSVWKKQKNANFLVGLMKDMTLSIGDIVYRDVITGDPSIYCRQPTLQLSNMTCLKTVVVKGAKSFSFNPNILPLFAGDFDGDEMNKYDPPEEGSLFEAFVKMGVDEMLISNGYGRPIVGQIMDGVLGCAMLTRDNIKLNILNACRVFDNTSLQPNLRKYIIPGTKDMIYGRSIFSALFETLGIKINYSNTPKYFEDGKLNAYRKYSETEVNIVIKDGVFISGIIDSKSIGNKAYGGIYHIIYHKYGAKAMRDVIWYMQRLSVNYLDIIGFTMSIEDFKLRDEEDKKIREYELSMVARSQVHTHSLWRGNIVAPSNKTVREHYEAEQIKILSETQTYNKYLHDGFDYENNHLYLSVYTGTKGSPGNMIDGVVSGGQALLDGARLMPELAGRVSHFHPRHTDDPRAYGFIINSYALGYTPNDIFCSSFVHRRGIVSKALSTADSGTKNRDGSSSLDSHILNYLRQVFKGPKLRQLLYGGDGMDPRATFKTRPQLLFKSDEELKKMATGEELATLIEDRDFYREVFINQNQRTGEDVKRLGFIPVNMPLIITDVNNLGGKPDSGNYKVIREFIDNIHLLYLNKNYSGPVPQYLLNNTKLFKAYLRYELRSEIVNKWSRNQLEILMHSIETDFVNNMEDPGTAVGIRASQATSEIMTQQSLSSIHLAAGNNADFKNVVNATQTENIKNLAMDIFFKHNDEEAINDFAKKIEMLKFVYFIKQYQIFYESHDNIVHPKYKDENKLIAEKSKISEFPKDILKWCIRVEFNISRVVTKNIQIEEIYIQLMKKFSFLHIIFGTLNDKTPVMRIYLKQATLNKYQLKNVNAVNILVQDLLETIVRGIDGIQATHVLSKKVYNEKFEENSLFYIKTEGSNLAKILAFPEVDTYLTKTNAMREYEDYFGIAITYNAVLDGIRMGVEGAYNSHYTVMANEMCSRYFYSAINRNGSAQRESSVMQLAADGAFMRVIKNAAVKGKIDYNIGVNSALMMGTTPKIGTNFVNVIYNETFIKKEGEKNIQELENI